MPQVINIEKPTPNDGMLVKIHDACCRKGKKASYVMFYGKMRIAFCEDQECELNATRKIARFAETSQKG